PVDLGAHAQGRHQSHSGDDDTAACCGGQEIWGISWELRSVRRVALVLIAGVLLDVVDCLADVADLLRLLVRDLDPELLLARHHQLDDVERVGAQVVGEAGIQGDLVRVHAELLDDDALDLVCDSHGFPPYSPISGFGSSTKSGVESIRLKYITRRTRSGSRR